MVFHPTEFPPRAVIGGNALRHEFCFHHARASLHDPPPHPITHAFGILKLN
jgi:hypothetical protein